MHRIDRKLISRLAAPAAASLVVALGVSACGSPASKPSAAQATSPTKSSSASAKTTEHGTVSIPRPLSTTTLKPPAVTPTFLDLQACRSFVSFQDLASGGGDTAALAIGEVGGMIQVAQQASVKAGGKGAPAKLLGDLQALLAVTKSPQWTGHASETKLPQVIAVATDCKPVLS